MINFGKYKDAGVSILIENYRNKDKFKSLVKEFYSILNNSEILRENYILYNKIENVNLDEPELIKEFIDETLNSIKDNLEYCGCSEKKLKEFIDRNNGTIKENLIDDIINTPKFKIKERIELKKRLIENVSNRPKKEKIEVNLPLSVYSSVLVEKFNEKYKDLNEEDKSIIKAVLDKDYEKLKESYNNLKQTTLNKIDTLIEESEDTLLINKLKVIKERFENEDSNEINEEKIIKIIQLNNTLNEE